MTYKTAGTAKLRGSHIRRRFLWVGLWVGKLNELRSTPPHSFPRTTFLDSFRVSPPRDVSQLGADGYQKPWNYHFLSFFNINRCWSHVYRMVPDCSLIGVTSVDTAFGI
jgi:hypothetical protein